MNYLSFFSGALGLDLGLEKKGFSPLLYCEIDKHCQKTISTNRPNIPLIKNIDDYSIDEIREISGLSKSSSVDLVVGGPPCQAFSTAGARKSFADVRGNIFIKYLEIATELKAKYIVIENVRGLLSAAYNPSSLNKASKGSALKFVIDYLEEKGYGVSFNLYNSANYGVPQIRERIIIIATLSGTKLRYLNPTHSENEEYGLLPWLSLKDAIHDIPQEKNKICASFPEKRLKYYRRLKSGENWRNLPEELQKEALGKSYYLGGGKTGFLRRLSWNRPSPTLVTSPTMPATDLAHPTEDRPLSVAEYARIQQFPDDWIFAGKMSDQYRQIGNAVPCGLGSAIADLLLNHENNIEHIPPLGFRFSRYRFTNDSNWSEAFSK